MAIRLKTDENLPDSAARVRRAAGHHVTTALEQNLGGVADPSVVQVCRIEMRGLVMLKRGLGNITGVSAEYYGIGMLRPRDQSLEGDSLLGSYTGDSFGNPQPCWRALDHRRASLSNSEIIS